MQKDLSRDLKEEIYQNIRFVRYTKYVSQDILAVVCAEKRWDVAKEILSGALFRTVYVEDNVTYHLGYTDAHWAIAGGNLEIAEMCINQWRTPNFNKLARSIYDFYFQYFGGLCPFRKIRYAVESSPFIGSIEYYRCDFFDIKKSQIEDFKRICGTYELPKYVDNDIKQKELSDKLKKVELANKQLSEKIKIIELEKNNLKEQVDALTKNKKGSVNTNKKSSYYDWSDYEDC